MRVRFHTTIDNELLVAAKVKAAQEGKKVNDILEELIRKYICNKDLKENKTNDK